MQGYASAPQGVKLRIMVDTHVFRSRLAPVRQGFSVVLQQSPDV